MKITKDNIKIGSEISCIRNLIVDSYEPVEERYIEALKGKKYIVVDIGDNMFLFINEHGKEHYIEFNDNKWFVI